MKLMQRELRENLNFNKNRRFDFFLIMWYTGLYKTKGVTLSNETKTNTVNELQIDKVYGDYFVKGDAVQLINWKSYKGANPIRVKDVEGQSHLQENEEVFNLQFVDGTEINLSHIQLFSILNDTSLRYQIKTEAWTLNEINKDTWKGTIATEPVVNV